MNDGGPAFPSRYATKGHYEMPSDGMSLRDYLAAQALTGCLASPTRFHRDGKPVERDAQLMATIAYEIADAMIQARSTTTP